MQKKNIEDKKGNEKIKIFFDEIKLKGFQLVICVPCSLLNGLISYVSHNDEFLYICASNEGEAAAIAVGAKLAGYKSIIICQNSGLGNMVNPLSSLSDTFGIPVFIIMSWRGSQKKEDAPQHKLMGSITLDILSLLKFKVFNFPTQIYEVKVTLENIFDQIENGNSCCLIVEEKIEDVHHNHINQVNPPIKRKSVSFYNHSKSYTLPTRREVLNKIVGFFPKETVFVATTGDTARELYELHDQDSNFYMVGSMGYASSIALGISLYYQEKVIVFDGDGALLMHMGNMATIGYYASHNFCHIVLNNKAHGTTGGQKNSAETVNFMKIAQSCNYSVILEAQQNNIEEVLSLVMKYKGPYFIHIEIDSSLNKTANRPQLTPKTNAERLSHFIRNNIANFINL